MSNDLIKIDFYGDEILAISNEQDGKEYIPLKRISDNVGNLWENEFRRIKEDEILNSSIVNFTIVAEDGKQREMICLSLDMLNGYLFGIPITKRTNPEVREKLIRYKKECYKALYEYFHSKQTKETMKDPMLAQLEVIKNMRIRQMELEKRVDDISIVQEDINKKVDRIEYEKKKTIEILNSVELATELPREKTTRTKINNIVRGLAYKTNSYEFIWNQIYKEFQDRYHVDIKRRATNEGIKPIAWAENNNYIEQLFSVATFIQQKVISQI